MKIRATASTCAPIVCALLAIIHTPASAQTPIANMVWIPPGSFVMGSPATEAQRADNETQHLVTLSRGFYMGKYLVTQKEYLSLTGMNPSYFATVNGYTDDDLKRPVEMVSWNDASNYCARLTEQEQLRGRLPTNWVYRLPTESEWEYSCRAGTTTAFYVGDAVHGNVFNYNTFYEYDASIGDITVTPTNYFYHTTAVGSYQPNAFGLYDMHGNVWEYCSDWYGDYPAGPVIDPQGPDTGTDRARHGGSFLNRARICRSAFRGSSGPSEAFLDIGFRIVLAQVSGTSASAGCTQTMTYWKEHNPTVCINSPNSPLCVSWPVTSLVLGNNVYNIPTLVSILNTPAGNNGLTSMAQQLIAAKLNIANSADGSVIIGDIATADALIGNLTVGVDSLPVSSTSSLTTALLNYNKGTTGPGHCK